jgi:hypothetical protein
MRALIMRDAMGVVEIKNWASRIFSESPVGSDEGAAQSGRRASKIVPIAKMNLTGLRSHQKVPIPFSVATLAFRVLSAASIFEQIGQ